MSRRKTARESRVSGVVGDHGCASCSIDWEQAPYQVNDATRPRLPFRYAERVPENPLKSALYGKIFPLDVRAHFEVVNKRVCDCCKQPRRHCLVGGMVKIRAKGVDIVEFKDRCVREIETCERFVRSANQHPPPDTCAADRRDVVEGGGPRLDKRTPFFHRHLRSESKQHDVSEQRRGPFQGMPCCC